MARRSGSDATTEYPAKGSYGGRYGTLLQNPGRFVLGLGALLLSHLSTSSGDP